MYPRARMFGSLFVLALAVRAIRFPTIFTDAGVHLPLGGDAYYHLRRIWYSVVRFPETLPFDRYVSFPEGSEIVWPPTFDWVIAALIRPFVDTGDQIAVESMAVWVPATLGAATTGLVALFGERLYGRGAGWCAGLLYSVLPMSFVFSQLGMIDHHVAVAFLTTGMLWLSFEIFSLDRRSETWAAALAGRTGVLCAALGVVIVLTLRTWPGSLLHIGVLQFAFVSWWLLAGDRAQARTRALAFASIQLIAAIGVAPFAIGVVWREYEEWSPLVLSNFQAAYFAGAAGFAFAAQLLHDRSSLGESPAKRFVSGVVLGTGGVLITLVAVPQVRHALLFASGWFMQGEELLGLINEMRPLFARNGRFGLNFPIQHFGAGLLIVPFVYFYLGWSALRERSAPYALILFWTLAFIALTLQQWRFGNTLGVVYVLLLGAALAEWIATMHQSIALGRWRSFRSAAGVSIVLIVAVWTTVAFSKFYRPIVANSLRALASNELRNRGPLVPGQQLYVQVGEWIRKNTQETSGYLDRALQPEYSVLSNWETGHLLRYVSERPMVQDNFGPYAGRNSFESAWQYFAERDENAAVEILDRLGVRYVVGSRMGAGTIDGLAHDSMAMRLRYGFGSRTWLRGSLFVPALARHRLVFYTHSAPPTRVGPGLRVPAPFEALGVWEIVEGARVEGRATSGATIQLALKVMNSGKVGQLYFRETVADERGAYRFVVPYPTDVRFSPDVKVGRAYQLRSARGSSQLRVREEDVLAGAVVQGPDLSRH